MDNQTQTQIQAQIVEELGLANLPQDKQEELLIKMTEVLLKRIFVETMDKLGDQGRDEYEKVIESGASPEQVEEFLKAQITDYDQVVQKVIADFKAEMKDDIK